MCRGIRDLPSDATPNAHRNGCAGRESRRQAHEAVRRRRDVPPDQPQGSRLWRLKYRIHGKEELLASGAYPDVSLKRAREKRDEARRLLAAGIDSSAQRKAVKLADADTFAALAREWLALQQKKFSAKTYAKAVWIFETLLWALNPAGPAPAITTSHSLFTMSRQPNEASPSSARPVIRTAFARVPQAGA